MIDTHTHVVASDKARYPLEPRSLSGEWYLEAPCSSEQLLGHMREAGVSQAILVQAVGAYTYRNDYAADSAAANPDRFASACCIDPLADDAIAVLKHWVRERGMQGIRLFAIPRNGVSWLEDPRSFPVWQAAHDLGIHVIATVVGSQLRALQRVVRRFPEIRTSLDHCGFPDPTDPSPLFELDANANLHCKVSTVVLDTMGSEAPSFIEQLVARFGAERVMWGSDFSQTHDRSYTELVTLARQSFSVLTETQQQQCFVGTPQALWPSLA